MKLQVEVTGIDNLTYRLTRLQSSLVNWSDSLTAVGESFKKYYASVPFASRGSVFGRTWEELSPQYESWKAKNYPGRPILIRSGELMRSFDFTSTRDQVRIFNRADHFAKHQKGEGVPQRISMALNKNRIDAAREILQGELERKVNL